MQDTDSYAFAKIPQFSSHFSSSLHQFDTINLRQENLSRLSSPKSGDVQTEFEGVMNDYMARNGSKNLVVPTAWITDGMDVKFFQRLSFY